VAKFTVDVNGTTVEIELFFHSLGSNTWNITGGDTNVLPASQGTWTSSGIDNRVFFSDSSRKEFMTFYDVNIDVVSLDRFKNLAPGDTGSAILVDVEGVSWRFDSL
jgi:hypothetical protein